MQIGYQNQLAQCGRGFSLVLVLSILSAVLLLVVAVFSTLRFESLKADAYDNAFRAELAAEAALNAAISDVARVVGSDDFVVFTRERPDGTRVLIGADWNGRGWDVVPLVSGNWQPGDVTNLSEVGDAPDADGVVPVYSHLEKPTADAVELNGVSSGGDPYTITRYRYWVEDLQGYLNADAVGNTLGDDGDAGDLAGEHRRVAYPFGAPGEVRLEDVANSPSGLPQGGDIALFVIDPSSAEGKDAGGVDFDNLLIENRGRLRTSESMFHVLPGSLDRDAEGRLTDQRLRAFEENVVVGLPPYREQARVPFMPKASGVGLAYAGAGLPKTNLNQLLGEASGAPGQATASFAEQVERQLPGFASNRAGSGNGGFVEDYLRTLAANAIDYADVDDVSTLNDGVYRGLDSFPLVSELHYRFRWEGVKRENNRVYAILQVTQFVELWNMTNREVSGEAQLSFECGNQVSIGFNSYVFDEPSVAGDPAVTTPQLESKNGLYWAPPFDVELRPNEYKMYAMQTYEFKLDAGPSGTFIPSPIYVEESDTRGYSFLWNGQRVDKARAGCERNGGTLYYPSGDRQKYRCTIPGHSYGKYGDFANNVGDPRAAYYIQALQGACAFPHNAASPGRRNVRWDIYRGGEDKIYGRVIPSEWGDGAHDSPLGTIPPGVKSKGNHRYDMIENSAHGDTGLSPRFGDGAPPLTEVVQQMAPQRITNLGYFASETELGHVFDPLPYDQKVGSRNTDGDGFFDIEASDSIDNRYAGGHTLRVGRPAHSRFAAQSGTAAWHLLDLFHAGILSEDAAEREGVLREVFGEVNLNTARPDVLRAVAGGLLKQDLALGRVVAEARYGVDKSLDPLELSAPTAFEQADLVASSIIEWRKANGPFISPSQLSQVTVAGTGTPLFGSREAWSENLDNLEWSDAGAEELFARVYNGSTTRSRNFRVFVVGEVVNRATGQVIGRYSKVVHLFADPGERAADGGLQPNESRIRVTYESTL